MPTGLKVVIGLNIIAVIVIPAFAVRLGGGFTAA
jgi:hypothetical protein